MQSSCFASLRASGSHARPHKRLCTPPSALAGTSAIPSLLLNHIKLTPRGADPTEEARTSCAQCRYPCEGHGTSCGAHDYLARWKEDAFMKPDGYDHSLSLPIASAAGVDAAAISMGGRANGRWKSSNQDAFLLTPLHSHGAADGSFLVGVFDGHGKLGHEVAARARDAIATCAAGSPAPSAHADPDDHEDWLAAHFEAASAEIDGANADFTRSGAAAVVCAVRPGRITAAWAGDSRAVLGLQGAPTDTAPAGARAVIPLTRDHKPNCPKEAERILAAGGRVDRLATDREGNPTGPYRVFLPDCWAPGLALSRAFGDHLVRDIGVVPTPEVYSMAVPTPVGAVTASGVSNLAAACTMATPGDGPPAASRHVLIAASDGLWEWMSNEEAVALAWSCDTAAEAAELLVNSAQREWAVRYRGRACDDITVAVTFLPAC